MSIKLKGSTAGSVALDAPANTSPSGSDISFTLPIADGSSGQVLTTNGSGALSFANAGKILQVVQTTKTDQFSTTSNSFVDVTGLSVSITPSSTSNKILVLAMVALGGGQLGVIHGKIVRGSTDLLVGDASSNRTRANFSFVAYGIESTVPTCNFQYLDSPSSTSAQTYKLQVVSPGEYTVGVNRSGFHGDNSSYPVCASTITVMEVAA